MNFGKSLLQRIISSPIFLKLKAYVGSCFFEKLKDLLAGCQPRLDTRQSFPTHLSVSFDLSKLSDSTKNSYSWCDDKQTNNIDCIYWPLRFCLLVTNVYAFILLVINLNQFEKYWEKMKGPGLWSTLWPLSSASEKNISDSDSESDEPIYDLPLRPLSDFTNARLEKVLYYRIHIQ